MSQHPSSPLRFPDFLATRAGIAFTDLYQPRGYELAPVPNDYWNGRGYTDEQQADMLRHAVRIFRVDEVKYNASLAAGAKSIERPHMWSCRCGCILWKGWTEMRNHLSSNVHHIIPVSKSMRCLPPLVAIPILPAITSSAAAAAAASAIAPPPQVKSWEDYTLHELRFWGMDYLEVEDEARNMTRTKEQLIKLYNDIDLPMPGVNGEITMGQHVAEFKTRLHVKRKYMPKAEEDEEAESNKKAKTSAHEYEQPPPGMSAEAQRAYWQWRATLKL